MKSVTEQVFHATRGQVRGKLHDQVEYQVREKGYKQVMHPVWDEVYNRTCAQMWVQTEEEL